jgi:hypothetical protein
MKMSMILDAELHPIVTLAPSGNERSPSLHTPYAPRTSERNLRKPQYRADSVRNTVKDFIQD